MIKPKKKLCIGCDSLQYIWKNQGGNRYCKDCSNTGVAKLGKSKPKSKQKPISPRSSKRAKEEVLYSTMRVIFLKQHSTCQANVLGCANKATEIHHKVGRIGKLLLDTTQWLAICRTCHQWVENNPTDAKELGLSGARLKN